MFLLLHQFDQEFGMSPSPKQRIHIKLLNHILTILYKHWLLMLHLFYLNRSDILTVEKSKSIQGKNHLQDCMRAKSRYSNKMQVLNCLLQSQQSYEFFIQDFLPQNKIQQHDQWQLPLLPLAEQWQLPQNGSKCLPFMPQYMLRQLLQKLSQPQQIIFYGTKLMISQCWQVPMWLYRAHLSYTPVV